MADKPEERARAEIDRPLAAASCSVQSVSDITFLPDPHFAIADRVSIN